MTAQPRFARVPGRRAIIDRRAIADRLAAAKVGDAPALLREALEALYRLKELAQPSP